jgi:glycosyltransferase involved in cell wall biosynthesis
VELTFNDSTIVEARMGDLRPDVPSELSLPWTARACGWSAWVNLATLPEGDLRVAVTGFPRRERPVRLGGRGFRLTASTLTGSIDSPRDGEQIHGDELSVRGWSFIDGRGPARVEVTIDGRSVGRASVRIPRPDLASSSASEALPLSGFEYHGAFPVNARGRVKIGATVLGFDGGRESLAPRTVRRAVRTPFPERVARTAILRNRTQRLIESSKRESLRQDLHLLVFAHSLRIGGGELYLSELLRNLAPRLPHCTVVAPADGPLRDLLEEWGIEVVVTGRKLGGDAETFEGQIRELALFILGSHPDVVLLNTLVEWPAGDAAQRIGIPIIWSIHESFRLERWLDLTVGLGEWDPYLKERLVATLAATDRLIFEAEATSTMFAPYADAQRRLVVPYGVDVEAIGRYQDAFDRRAARAEQGIHGDAVVLLCIGVVETRKATACLMEAFTHVAVDHPGATLIVVGDHPCLYSELLHRLIDEADLGDRLRLLPISPEIWRWYAVSDVLVSASDIESLPRSMLEAMAFGLPTLSANVFGIPELVEDGQNGWLFPADDIAELIAALRRVLDMPAEERLTVGEAGRETVRRHHRSAGYGDRYWQMINELALEGSVSAGRAVGGQAMESSTIR